MQLVTTELDSVGLVCNIADTLKLQLILSSPLLTYISIDDEIEIFNLYHRIRHRVLNFNIEDFRLLFLRVVPFHL